MNNLGSIVQLAQAMRGGGNPQALLRMAAQNNPQLANALSMIQGKSEAELKTMATNMCRERGTTPDAVIQDLLRLR